MCRSFRLIIFVSLFLFACTSGKSSAYAQQNEFVPPAMVPWMSAQGLTTKKESPRRETWEKRGRFEKIEGYGANKRMSAIPLLTPRDTLKLMEQLSDLDVDEQTALEKSYSDRVDKSLQQFGYALFTKGKAKKQKTSHIYTEPQTDSTENEQYGDIEERERKGQRYGLPAGAVQDDFVLDMGDRLEILFRGQLDRHDVYAVNNDGLLIVENMPPVPAAGRTIGAVRKSLAAYAERLHNTEIYVSLETVKQIDVLITGHVKEPGRQTLTVFHSVLDALMEAGGIEKTGSLRNIKVVRHNKSIQVDLYDLLSGSGGSIDLSLRDGDRIIVPPIGKNVAVAGGVKRPGIYELSDSEQSFSLQRLLTLGGDVLKPGHNRFLKLSLTGDGQETVTDIKNAKNARFANGSILVIEPAKEKRADMVMLSGHASRPGLYALSQAETLSELFKSDKIFGPDIYPLIGVIERWNKAQMTKEWIAFPPLMVVHKDFDRRLEDGDVIHLFSRAQILELQDYQENYMSDEAATRLLVPAAYITGHEKKSDMLTDPVLISFLQEHNGFIRGAIRQAGAYPLAPGATLENLIAVAGGMTREANKQSIEVTSALNGEGHQKHGRSGTRRQTVDLREQKSSDISLEPGDTVRINQKKRKAEDQSVLIVGEVKHPGTYDLLPGDKMSDLLRRAGGVSMQAYPDGAIFSRMSARLAEEKRYRNLALDLERSIAMALEDEDEHLDTRQISMARDLAAELREVEAVGRITVEADPAVLALEADLDILLQAGDKIYIPPRPLTVNVAGEVLSPAALQFRKNKNSIDYIEEAGGFTFNADKDRAFVVYPDGSAQPLQVSYWNHKPVFIPPGSTIVVPRDPEPFSFVKSAREVSQILSNLAVTGIFLDDISD